MGAPGTRGALLIEPTLESNRREYGILRSFESDAAAEAFYASDLYTHWHRRVAPLVIGEPSRRQLHGLEGFFRGHGSPPPRWKMAIVTWMGVFPTALLFSRLLAPSLSFLPTVVASAVVNACIVATLTWLVMPFLTKALRAWLRPRT